MPPITDWQLVQTHVVVEPPSYVSMDEFPTQQQSFISFPKYCVYVGVMGLGISSDSIGL